MIQKLYPLGLLLLLFCACHRPLEIEDRSNPKTAAIDSSLLIPAPDPFSSLVALETPYGEMKMELYFEPSGHRENMLQLIRQNFYDSLLFHRVIEGFMIQGGDPSSRQAKKGQRLGGGGNGQLLTAEILPQYPHIKGALAAARQSDELNPEKKSSASQFYIVQGSKIRMEQLDQNERKYNMVYGPENRMRYKYLGGSPQLDMNYSVFGRVYEGLDIIDSIAAQTKDQYGRPQEDIWMKFRIIKE
ncbi:peptidyl-prolyl cis-trans isomerase (rotamase) - cyclophilin family [Saprospira grandis DSM 2844]|uniref:peptidylprolyl isomerase n=1 Tax=Saprospira grandis DSM 2844 TaxID=694433 RepID=J0XU46_9BACT|nr:peptidylprolyl isomerase [Saprospira grandis]EJF52496.1 peptidyl-prolyl cis-trans isomerase (rotamase) - cyclophilin family [Saprospira grandis DSM 2844]